MKVFKLLLFLLFSYSTVTAQSYAVIKDKDGFVNVRQEKSPNSRAVGKIFKDDTFLFDESDKSKWVKIYQQTNHKLLEGYISANKIYPLSRYYSLKTIKTGRNFVIAGNDSIKVIIKSTPFNSKNARLIFSKPEKSNYSERELIKINGRHFWGTDGAIPKTVINSLIIEINGKQLEVSSNNFNDLYEPQLSSLNIYLAKTNIIYIEMDNSDGAGAYTVFWIVKNNKLSKRQIDTLND